MLGSSFKFELSTDTSNDSFSNIKASFADALFGDNDA
jgi:hypothetical protein